MNKEENLIFGGRNVMDEVNHVYRCLDVYYLYYVFLMCTIFMSLNVLGQSLYLLWYKWSSDLSVNVLNAEEKISFTMVKCKYCLIWCKRWKDSDPRPSPTVYHVIT